VSAKSPIDRVIGVRWGLHASSFNLLLLKTAKCTQFWSKCLLEIIPADPLDNLLYK